MCLPGGVDALITGSGGAKGRGLSSQRTSDAGHVTYPGGSSAGSSASAAEESSSEEVCLALILARLTSGFDCAGGAACELTSCKQQPWWPKEQLRGGVSRAEPC